MRNTRHGLPIHILALATLGPQLLTEGGDGGDGGGSSGGGDAGGGGRDPVPYDRFKSVNDKYNASKSRIGELEAEIQSLTEKAATVDTLASTLKDREETWGRERAGLQERLGLSELGLTSTEGQTVARSLYNSLGEEARKDVTFTDQVKAWKEKPEDAPAGMRPYLGAVDTESGGSRRDANKGAGGESGGTGAGSGVTLAALRAAREAAVKSGNWDAYDKLIEGVR